MKLKVRDLKCFPHIASVIGEIHAERELLEVVHCGDCHDDDHTDHTDIEFCFTWMTSPQGYDFWSDIDDGINPYTQEKERLDETD